MTGLVEAKKMQQIENILAGQQTSQCGVTSMDLTFYVICFFRTQMDITYLFAQPTTTCDITFHGTEKQLFYVQFVYHNSMNSRILLFIREYGGGPHQNIRNLCDQLLEYYTTFLQSYFAVVFN